MQKKASNWFKKQKTRIIISTCLTVVLSIGTIVGGSTVGYGMNLQSNGMNDSVVEIVSEGGICVSGDAVISTADAVKIGSLHAPIINDETQEVTFSYLYFGNYPQSEVTGEALTEDIVEADYVSGEAVVDGEKYRRISVRDARTFEEWMENEGGTFGKPKDKVLFYNWDDGGYRYFRYEPIKWKVWKIDGYDLHLMSEKILDESIYDHKFMTLFGWSRSVIRQWLNETEDGFMGKAFNENQQNIIQPFIDDKIWLMGEGDLEDYVFYYSGARSELTDYAYARGGKKGNVETMYSEYWLYSTLGEVLAGCVGADGSFKKRGEENDWAYTKMANEVCGVVPYIIIDIQNTSLWKTVEEMKQESEPAPIESEKPMESLPPVEPTYSPEVTNKPLHSVEPLYSVKPVQPTEPAKENVSSSPKPTLEYLSGDVNMDGQITLEDAQLILKRALKITGVSAEQMLYADVNEDDAVTLSDAQVVLKKALKIVK